MSGKRSVLDGVLYFINILFALGLLLSYLAYYIPPGLFTLFSFAATGFPVLAVTNMLFVVYWAIRLKRKIFLPLICLAVGYMHLPRMFQFGQAKKVVAEDQSLKVMSFNVRMFNTYRWLDDEEVEAKITRLIDQQDPDVLLLQEYHEEDDKPLHGLDFPYHRAKLDDSGKKVGLMIFSKFPITGSQVLEMKQDTTRQSSFHFADVKWKGQNIRVINVHLASVGLEDADYNLLENPDYKNEDKMQNGLKTIVKRLHNSYQRRALQLKSLQESVRESPYPVVLAGDFNDVPQSFVYHQVDHDLEDAFLSGGEGFGRTYIRSPLPLRIDYIWYSEDLNAINFEVIDQKLSDHYPIVTELEYSSAIN